MRTVRHSVYSVYSVAFLSVALFLCSAACGGKRENDPPIATPSVALNKDRVPIDSVVTLTYKFNVAPDAKFDKDYWVFMHVLDSDGEQMWTDDHQPPTPTSQWKPGQTIEYTRTIFVPNYPYIGEAKIRLGLYDLQSGKRLPLNAPEASRREYLVGKFQILSSENIFLYIRTAGIPRGGRKNENQWTWTKKTATISFKNPKD